MTMIKSQVLAALEAAPASAGESPEVTALVVRAQGGDADAFDDLMRLYEGRIIALGLQLGLSRDDAMDSCQDAFIKVFKYIGRFRTGNSFFKWLYRIAIHAIYDHRRRYRPQGSGVISIEELGPSQGAALQDIGPSLSRCVEAADLAGKLLAGLDLLSQRERTVFALRDLQGLGTAEIGRILRLNQVTVRRHCLNARQKLRQRLFPPAD
jgi:RNA polymerase sigma-70 factor (ECF subfamily)